ncbi:MAG: hypothetical protein JNK48_02635 [Bryobacterales bacterium]|nr:hypothetical protein [Bryobacterales bacterium]
MPNVPIGGVAGYNDPGALPPNGGCGPAGLATGSGCLGGAGAANNRVNSPGSDWDGGTAGFGAAAPGWLGGGNREENSLDGAADCGFMGGAAAGVGAWNIDVNSPGAAAGGAGAGGAGGADFICEVTCGEGA